MITGNPQLDLTTREAERVLREAGLPVDPSDWDTSDWERAHVILENAQRVKLCRMLERPVRLTR